MKVVYICSPGHAGSTILELLLSGHPHFTSVGEITHLSVNIERGIRCSCMEELSNCTKWKPVFADIKKKHGVDILQDPYGFWLGEIRPSDEFVWYRNHPFRKWVGLFRRGYQYLYFRLGVSKFCGTLKSIQKSVNNLWFIYRSVSRGRSREFVVDSSKRYLNAVELYHKDPKRFRIIYLVRDGRSVVASHVKRGWSVELAVKKWIRFAERSQYMLSKHVEKGDMLTVKFEELCDSPNEQLDRIVNFVGADLGHSDEMLAMDRENLHSTGGNWTKFKSKLVFKTPKDWRETMSKEDLEYFNSQARHINQKLGYLD